MENFCVFFATRFKILNIIYISFGFRALLLFIPMEWDRVSELRPSTAYCSFPRWYIRMETHGGMILTGENWRTRRNTFRSIALSTTNSTWTKFGLRCERSTTKGQNQVNDLFFLSFPFPFVPLQRRGCLVAPLFLWVVFSTLCGWLVQQQGWRVKGWLWPSEQARSTRANSWLD
jgi:hypothetical protein